MRIAVLGAAQPDQGKEVPRPAGSVGPWHAGRLQRELDITERRTPWEQCELLEHQAPVRSRAGDPAAFQKDFACGRDCKTGDQVEQR